MKKVRFVKSSSKNVINPFTYGSDEYWKRRENLERFLNYTSDRIYWMWVNEELSDSQAAEMAAEESGEKFDASIEYENGGQSQQFSYGGVTQNSQVIKHFLTDNKEVGTKNLSTHYDSDTGVVRLKNYATIIAERDGNNVRLSTKKYSVTTSKIQSEVRREAKSMSLNIVDREMFADGGEIESQIKERLANASFELPLECIVYVPSTRDANAIIPKNEMQQRVKEVQKFLSNIFGGYSSANVDGGYVSPDKGLIQEDVVKVTAFATKDAIQKSMPKLVRRIQQWCIQWSQESMGFEFEGDLFYISKNSKFSYGGMVYGDGGEIADLKNKLGKLESQRANWIGQSKSKANKNSPYDNKIDEIYTKIKMLEANEDDTFSLPNSAEVNRRYGGKDMEQKTAQMFANIFHSDTSYSKFFRSLKTATQKEVFRKLQYPTYQQKWSVKPITNKSKDTIRFKKMFEDGGMVYGDGGTAEEQNKHMILSQAKQVAHHVEELQEILSKDPNIDSWVVAKMQDVSTGLSNITHYLDGKSEYANGGEIILGGGSMASVQDSILAKGAKLKSGKITLGKLRSMIEEYNSQGRNFELRGAYNQLELWSNGNRLEAGSKEDIYRALIRYRYNPKYADGTELPEEIDFSSMTDEEIINFANTLSYYDRMDEGIEEEFDDVEDAKEYILLMEKGV